MARPTRLYQSPAEGGMMFESPVKPQQKTLDLIAAAVEVLEASPHPIGVKSVYYKLEGGDLIPAPRDSKESYRLVKKLERAIKIGRDMGLIRFEWLIDQGRQPTIWSEWTSLEDWLETAIDFKWSPWLKQPVYLEVFCEAGGLRGHFDAVCGEYHVIANYGRGNSSWTHLQEMGARIADRAQEFDTGPRLPIDQRTPRENPVVLCFGDYNRQGLNISNCVEEAMEKWCDVPVDVRRVCLLPEDLERYGLAGMRAKDDDIEAGWPEDDLIAEMEAMSNDDIAERIHEEIAGVMDLDALEESEAETEKERTKLRAMLNGGAE